DQSNAAGVNAAAGSVQQGNVPAQPDGPLAANQVHGPNAANNLGLEGQHVVANPVLPQVV
ncbi:hypothetical protein FRC11_001858, partial [Ceratobasidium sp. 423]